MQLANLFENAVPPPTGEQLQTLLQCRNLVIERIVSSADTIPTEMIQEQDEWVVLLVGNATLDVSNSTLDLHPGDYIFLPAGTPHKVLHTSSGALWLAVHLYRE